MLLSQGEPLLCTLHTCLWMHHRLIKMHHGCAPGTQADAPDIVLYDNACHLSEFAANREPDFFRNTLFVVDKFHWPNHTSCSRSFNSRLYPQSNAANSQLAEQFNKTLKKLATSVQFSKAENYKLFLTSFIILHNRKLIAKMHDSM